MSDHCDLTGEDLARFFAASPAAVCNRCGRKTWESIVIGMEDRMIQPDGNPCGGRFVEVPGE